MKHSNKISFSFASVLLLFFVVYGAAISLKQVPLFTRQGRVVSELGKELSGFDSKAKSLGSLGGFHFLEDFRVEEETDFYRITLTTSLNRATVDETLFTPLTKATLQEKPLPVSGLREEVGNCYLEVLLYDTVLMNLASNRLENHARQSLNLNRGMLTKAELIDGDEGTTKVLIGLTEKTPFRLRSDKSKNEVYIDFYKQS